MATKREGALTAFGEAIERRIKELQATEPQYTKDTVARLAGMSRQHLWRAQRGKTTLTPFEVVHLAKVLRLDPIAFVNSHLGDAHRSDSEVQGYRRAAERAMNQLATGIDPDEQVRRLRNRLAHTPRVRETAADMAWATDAAGNRPLPRDLRILAEEFRLEALRIGADDREMLFIDSVLGSPEAIFRQSGFAGDELTTDEQRSELESVIAMLREWLFNHMRARGAKPTPP